MRHLVPLLQHMVATGASDLFVTTGRNPALRIQGQLISLDAPPVAAETLEEAARSVMSDAQYSAFLTSPDVNVSWCQPGLGRFRISLFRQRRDVALVARAIPSTVPSPEALGMPPLLKDVVMLRRGLIMMVGPTGTGKSTTLAALLNHRNQASSGHTITIEDPIEYLLNHAQSVVNQREVGIDTRSYADALRNALRQAPDVLMVGEILSADVMEQVLAYADTGHLCLAALHAPTAAQAFERIINMFPQHQREQVQLTLSLNIKAVVCQQLVPARDGTRVAAFEILLNTPRVADLVRRGELHQLHDCMEKGTTLGMQTLDQSLYNLCQQRVIDAETAVEYAQSFRNMRVRIKVAKAVKPASSL